MWREKSKLSLPKILKKKFKHQGSPEEMTERDLHHPIFFKKSGELNGKNARKKNRHE